MWTGSFWKQAAERAIKSAAQLGALAVGVDGLNLLDGFDWKATLGTALAAALASLFTSIATEPVGERGSPSMVELPRK